jgi:hypothetical protein
MTIGLRVALKYPLEDGIYVLQLAFQRKGIGQLGLAQIGGNLCILLNQLTKVAFILPGVHGMALN